MHCENTLCRIDRRTDVADLRGEHRLPDRQNGYGVLRGFHGGAAVGHQRPDRGAGPQAQGRTERAFPSDGRNLG